MLVIFDNSEFNLRGQSPSKTAYASKDVFKVQRQSRLCGFKKSWFWSYNLIIEMIKIDSSRLEELYCSSLNLKNLEV